MHFSNPIAVILCFAAIRFLNINTIAASVMTTSTLDDGGKHTTSVSAHSRREHRGHRCHKTAAQFCSDPVA